ncbi:MAG TPA: glycosyltransferase [Bacteroidales bacterium]|nr:glycosyltransferase [Bacteroidales bacterium]
MFSIIIVTWNNLKQAKECVGSIRDNSYYNDHEVIVVHNDVSILESPIDNVKNIDYRSNIGFSKAANAGADLAKKDYICIIDDDTTVTRNWDKHLLDAQLQTKSNWVCSTRIEPIAPKWNISVESYRRGFRPYLWYRNISNAPLLIPNNVWEAIGGYDEDFPNVGAELGLAKKAYDYGIRDFLQTPLSIAFHKQSQSMKRLPDIKNDRIKRDQIFKSKYGITRKKFVKVIGKGNVYEK